MDCQLKTVLHCRPLQNFHRTEISESSSPGPRRAQFSGGALPLRQGLFCWPRVVTMSGIWILYGVRVSETGRRMMAPGQSAEGARHGEMIDRTDDKSVFTPRRSGFQKCGNKLRLVKLRASPGKARPTRFSPTSPA